MEHIKLDRTFKKKITSSGQQATSNGSISDQVIELVNQKRGAGGIRALSENSGLTAAAQTHADYIANSRSMSLSHSVNSTGFSYWAENLALVPESSNVAGQAVLSWVNSSGHYRNMMNNYAYTGVGFSCKRSYCVIVQQFGS